MRKSRLVFSVLVSGVVSCLSAAPQSQPYDESRILGRISGAPPLVSVDLVVEITPLSGGGPPAQGRVSGNGNFEVRLEQPLGAGWVGISVLDASGRVLHRVTKATAGQPITVSLPREKIARPATGPVTGTVSFEALAHPPSNKFLRTMRRSERARRQSDLLGSAEYLSRAAALEPAQAEAQVRLGTAWLGLADYGHALAAFDRALTIAPTFEGAQSGRAISLHGLARLAEAEQQARLTLAAHPDNDRGHYVLASVLFERGRRDDAVLAHLERAAVKYPRALFLKALVYADRGQPGEEAKSLRRCVQSASGSAQGRPCGERLAKSEEATQ